MSKLRLIGTLVLAALLAGCLGGGVKGSGNLVTQGMDFADFDKLDVRQGFIVDVQQGNTFSVIIRVDDNLVDQVKVTKIGSTLRIGLKPGYVGKLKDATLEAEVTMPELTRLDLSGGSHVNLNSFSSTKTLVADLSSGSHLNGEADLGDVRFDLSGGSQVNLSGSARDLTLDVSGASHANLGNLEVVDADVTASGGSHATVQSRGKLNVDARSGSHVKYRGTPILVTIDENNSSHVDKE